MFPPLIDTPYWAPTPWYFCVPLIWLHRVFIWPLGSAESSKKGHIFVFQGWKLPVSKRSLEDGGQEPVKKRQYQLYGLFMLKYVELKVLKNFKIINLFIQKD